MGEEDYTQKELEGDLQISSGSLEMTCIICDQQIDATYDEEENYRRMKQHFIKEHGLKKED